MGAERITAGAGAWFVQRTRASRPCGRVVTGGTPVPPGHARNYSLNSGATLKFVSLGQSRKAPRVLHQGKYAATQAADGWASRPYRGRMR
jgi:hypothetical protein